MPVTLCILARAPHPGYTKTRLIPALGAQGAAAFHCQQTVRQVAAMYQARIGPVQLAITNPHPFFTRLQRRHPKLRLLAQREGDLGDRLAALAAAECGKLLLMGSDCPDLHSAALRAAARALDSAPSVIIPAHDGGYVLIGSRVGSELARSGIFDPAPWGSDEVLEITLRRLDAAGLPPCILEPLRDIDTPADYTRWRGARKEIT